MKIIIITLFVLLNTISLSAQQIDSALVKEIPIIKNNVFKQRKEINTLTKKIKQQNKTINDLVEKNKTQEKIIEELSSLTEVNKTNIVTNSKELGTKIQETTDNTKTKLSEINSTLGKNQLYWLLATLATIFLVGLMYLLIGKRINSGKTDVDNQIKNTKESLGDIQTQIESTKKILEEENIKLDTKLVEILDNQLKIQEEETSNNNNPVSSNGKIDHSLALKVADEIIRIQKNLSQMDNKTKGLKQLNSSVKRIQNNFAANGYEIVEMLGKDYNEGMKVTANFIPSEDIETGKEIITRIIKPQVNFNNEMIQSAQIEVSIGE
jgi:hypothetical protein